MRYFSTGQVAALLGVPEHRVTAQVRLAKIHPEFLLGRRAWTPDQVLQLSRLLGLDTPELRQHLAALIQPNEQELPRHG